MKKLVLICGLMVCLSLAACQQHPKAKFTMQQRYITIETEPEGAIVTQINLEGAPPTKLGVTPLPDTPVMVITSVDRMRNMPYQQASELIRRVGTVVVRIEKAGYQPYEGVLKTEKGQTVAHKIKLTPAN